MSEKLRTRLIEAINALPERDRIVLGLHYEYGLNVNEIAAVLGICEARVREIHNTAVSHALPRCG